jgi:hypothetical protein
MDRLGLRLTLRGGRPVLVRLAARISKERHER